MGRALTTAELLGNNIKSSNVPTSDLLGKSRGVSTSDLLGKPKDVTIDNEQSVEPITKSIGKNLDYLSKPLQTYGKSMYEDPWGTTAGTAHAIGSSIADMAAFAPTALANLASGVPKKDVTGDIKPAFFRDVVGKTAQDAASYFIPKEGSKAERIKKVMMSPFEAIEEVDINGNKYGISPTVGFLKKNKEYAQLVKSAVFGSNEPVTDEEIEWLVRSSVDIPILGFMLKGGIKNAVKGKNGRAVLDQIGKELKSDLERIQLEKNKIDVAPKETGKMLSEMGELEYPKKSAKNSAEVFSDPDALSPRKIYDPLFKQAEARELRAKANLTPRTQYSRRGLGPTEGLKTQVILGDPKTAVIPREKIDSVLKKAPTVEREVAPTRTGPIYSDKFLMEREAIKKEQAIKDAELLRDAPYPRRIGEKVLRTPENTVDIPTENKGIKYISKTSGYRNAPKGTEPLSTLAERTKERIRIKQGKPKSGSFLQDLNDMLSAPLKDERGSFTNRDLQQKTLDARQRVSDTIHSKLNEFGGDFNRVKAYLNGEGATPQQVAMALSFYKNAASRGIYEAPKKEEFNLRKSLDKKLGKREPTRTELLREKFNTKQSSPKKTAKNTPKQILILQNAIATTAKKKGIDKDTLKGIKKKYGGQESLVGDTPMGKEQLISVLRGVREHGSKFKKPGWTTKIKPKWLTARQIGVEPAFKDTGYTRASDVELPQEVYNNKVATDMQFKDLNKMSKTPLKEKVAKKFKGKPTGIEVKMAEILNENVNAPETFKDGTPLTKEQKQWFDSYRELTNYTLDATNKVRKEAGLEPIQSKEAYIKHELVPEILDEILDGRYEALPDIQRQIENSLNSKVFSPQEIKRKLGDELGEHFSKNLHELTNAMLYNNAREQILTLPRKKAMEWLSAHNMPVETRAWAKQFDKFLMGEGSPFDKQVIESWSRSNLRKLINLGLKPTGKQLSRQAIQRASRAVGKEMIRGTMWGFNPKMWIRNKMQILQGLAYHGSGSLLKSYAKTPKMHQEIIDKSNFLKDYTGIEETAPKSILTKLEAYGYKPFQWTAKSNVNRTMKASLHDFDNYIYDNFDKFKDVDGKDGAPKWYDPQRTSETPKGYRFPSEKKVMLDEAETNARHSQYGYLPSDMPEIFNSKTIAAITRLWSWPMNYFTSFLPDMLNRAVNGVSSTGRRLPPQMRLGPIRYLILSGSILKGLGYSKSFLAGVLPDGLNPAGTMATSLVDYIKADSEKQRERAWSNFKRSASSLIRGGSNFRNIKAVLDGHGEKAFLYPEQRK